MKKAILLLSLGCLLGWASAAHVDTATAKSIAATFWDQSGLSFRNSVAADEWHNVAPTLGLSQLYVFRAPRGGFVIVAADDCARPILAYSQHNDFGAGNLPQSVCDWLWGYESQIAEAAGKKLSALPEVAAEWEMLRRGEWLSPKAESEVQPLITATWGQGAPYNAMCPPNTLVGCVAVAMGEVMRYWQYPVHGTGSHSYTYGGQSHSVDFSAATYNYAAMPNSCSSNNTAVATLLYHCGVAVQMEYGSSVSSAYVLHTSSHPYNAESALKNFFGYSQNAHGELRSDYSKDQWISMLKADLDAGHPVIHNGYNASNSGGHCFVCDGYDNNNYFHFNWGQRGSYDGYFELDAMTPIPSQNFSYNQGGIFGLVPPSEEDEDGITENSTPSTIKLFPNPTSETVFISIQDEIQNTECQLYNIQGEIIFSQKITGNDFPIDLSGIANGTYFLHILKNGKTIEVKKVVRASR